MIDVKDLFKSDYIGKEVSVQGWIRNHRKQKDFGFIDFNDGTFFKNLQMVYDNKLDNFEELQKFNDYSYKSIKIRQWDHLISRMPDLFILVVMKVIT